MGCGMSEARSWLQDVGEATLLGGGGAFPANDAAGRCGIGIYLLLAYLMNIGQANFAACAVP